MRALTLPTIRSFGTLWCGRSGRREWRRSSGSGRSFGTRDCRHLGRCRCGDRCGGCSWRRGRSSRFDFRRRSCWNSRRFRNGLHGGPTTSSDRAFSRRGWFGFGFGRGSRGGSATPTSCGRWSSDTRSLLALPTGANAGDLIVAQWAQMTTHRNVHLTKEIDHLVARNSELARQVMYSKLAQPSSSPTLRPSDIGVGLSARIPFARPLSTIPTTVVVSRPAADPSAAAGGPTTTVIPRA